MRAPGADLLASAATAAPAALVVDGPLISWRGFLFAVLAMLLGVLPGVVRELARLAMVAIRARRVRLERTLPPPLPSVIVDDDEPTRLAEPSELPLRESR